MFTYTITLNPTAHFVPHVRQGKVHIAYQPFTATPTKPSIIVQHQAIAKCRLTPPVSKPALVVPFLVVLGLGLAPSVMAAGLLAEYEALLRGGILSEAMLDTCDWLVELPSGEED